MSTDAVSARINDLFEQQAWTEAAQGIYASASAEQQSAPNGSAADSDHEVVEDAEYEVVDE